jgi:uncharacterized protein involved in exopolysaccharide biosynthesis
MLQRQSPEVDLSFLDQEEGFDLSYYLAILRKRFLYFFLPFLFVSAAGGAATVLWPPTYMSEGKILVESQQIPTDLVRPTVTSTAKERIQVIQQRVMTRDNLLALLDKYKLYPDRRDRLSRTELLDLMRENIHVEPIDLDQASGRASQTIALKVGFSDRSPQVATQLANELVTLFLNEDARNRTNRAMETTRFLARESQRLEGELAAIETKLAEAKRQFRASSLSGGLAADPSGNAQVSPLTAVKMELAQKRTVYSKSHPVIKRLEAQLAALQKMEGAGSQSGSQSTGQGQSNISADDALEAVVAQRNSIQKNLEAANQKLAAARLGESLERDQFSERLQVIEQAVAPQKPIKPNRFKIAALGIFAGALAGFAGIFTIENFDRTIRGSRDLVRLAGETAIVIIPYLTTEAEKSRSRRQRFVAAGTVLLLLATAALGTHFLYRPLDELWPLIVAKYL